MLGSCPTGDGSRDSGVAWLWPVPRCSFLLLLAELDGRGERGTTSRKRPKPARLLEGFGRDGEEGERGSELREKNSLQFDRIKLKFELVQYLPARCSTKGLNQIKIELCSIFAFGWL